MLSGGQKRFIHSFQLFGGSKLVFRMPSSNDELVFQRLLYRSKKLCMEDLAKNVYRLKAAVTRLQEIFSQMQDNKYDYDDVRNIVFRSMDSDVLMQYGRDLYQLKVGIYVMILTLLDGCRCRAKGIVVFVGRNLFRRQLKKNCNLQMKYRENFSPKLTS